MNDASNDATAWLSAIIVGGLLLISMGLWAYVIARQRSGQRHFFSADERLKLPLGMVDVLLAFAMWLMGQTMGLVVTMAIMGDSTFDPASMSSDQSTVLGYAVGICSLVSTVLTLAYLYARYQSPKVFGGIIKNIRRDIALGGLVFLCFVPITFVVQSVLTQIWEYEHPTLELISPDASLVTILSAWWMAVLVAPVAEEFLFRGILQGWLSRLFVRNERPEAAFFGGWPGRRMFASSATIPQKNADHGPAVHDAEEIDASVDSSPPVTDEATNPYAAPKNVGMKDLPSDEPSFYVATAWAPVVISAVLFGLVHLGQGPAPIPIFVFGLGLGMIYRQTGRILPCIVAHFMLNGFSMTVYTVEQLYFPSDAVETAPALEPAVSLLTLWM